MARRDEGMLAMAEANGEVALRNPDALVKEIERTREDLARTIDTLAERVSPANVARRALSRAKDQMSRPEVQLAGGAALVAVVTLALLTRRRRRG
jgi:2-phosphoglycerate kinase